MIYSDPATRIHVFRDRDAWMDDDAPWIIEARDDDGRATDIPVECTMTWRDAMDLGVPAVIRSLGSKWRPVR